MKVYFYINKSINFESGKIKFSSNDLCTLKLNIKKNKSKILINIHNVYNSSSVNIKANDGPSTIPFLSEALKNSKKHLMMSDFNFYHSYGKGPKVKKQHVWAKALLEMMEKNALELTLSVGTITGKKKSIQHHRFNFYVEHFARNRRSLGYNKKIKSIVKSHFNNHDISNKNRRNIDYKTKNLKIDKQRQIEKSFRIFSEKIFEHFNKHKPLREKNDSHFSERHKNGNIVGEKLAIRQTLLKGGLRESCQKSAHS